jgi:hypothetical protein
MLGLEQIEAIGTHKRPNAVNIADVVKGLA